jgi:hypothetical protein
MFLRCASPFRPARFSLASDLSCFFYAASLSGLPGFLLPPVFHVSSIRQAFPDCLVFSGLRSFGDPTSQGAVGHPLPRLSHSLGTGPFTRTEAGARRSKEVSTVTFRDFPSRWRVFSGTRLPPKYAAPGVFSHDALDQGLQFQAYWLFGAIGRLLSGAARQILPESLASLPAAEGPFKALSVPVRSISTAGTLSQCPDSAPLPGLICPRAGALPPLPGLLCPSARTRPPCRDSSAPVSGLGPPCRDSSAPVPGL